MLDNNKSSVSAVFILRTTFHLHIAYQYILHQIRVYDEPDIQDVHLKSTL
jgi:hypothetical protein